MTIRVQIPEKELDSRPRSNSAAIAPPPTPQPQLGSASALTSNVVGEDEQVRDDDSDSDEDESESTTPIPTPNAEAIESQVAFSPSQISGSIDTSHPTTPTTPTRMRHGSTRRPVRRLSTFESPDGVLDLESRRIGGSARSFETGSWSGRSGSVSG